MHVVRVPKRQQRLPLDRFCGWPLIFSSPNTLIRETNFSYKLTAIDRYRTHPRNSVSAGTVRRLDPFGTLTARLVITWQADWVFLPPCRLIFLCSGNPNY